MSRATLSSCSMRSRSWACCCCWRTSWATCTAGAVWVARTEPVGSLSFDAVGLSMAGILHRKFLDDHWFEPCLSPDTIDIVYPSEYKRLPAAPLVLRGRR